MIRPRNLFRALLLVTLPVLFCCSLAETALRIAHFRKASIYESDAVRGWKLRSGAEGYVSAEAGRVYVRINQDGMRDQEHSLAKAARLCR